MISETPKLDAAVDALTANLRHMDARLTLSADIDPDSLPLDAVLRATLFRVRIRETLKELEISQCK